MRLEICPICTNSYYITELRNHLWKLHNYDMKMMLEKIKSTGNFSIDTDNIIEEIRLRKVLFCKSTQLIKKFFQRKNLKLKKIEYGDKSIGTSEEGIKRELELLKDKCITCVHCEKPIKYRFCIAKKLYLKSSVRNCGLYTNNNLDIFILESKGLISPSSKGV